MFASSAFCNEVSDSQPSSPSTLRRVIAHGDVHGEFDGLKEDLFRAGLINSEGQWSGRNALLVQVGDVIDRGPRQKESVDFLRKLQIEAKAEGGGVVRLLGNHELMLLQGVLFSDEALANWVRNLPLLEQNEIRDAVPANGNLRGAVLKNPVYLELFETMKSDVIEGTLLGAAAVQGRLYLHAGIRSALRDQLERECAKDPFFDPAAIGLEDLADQINQLVTAAMQTGDFSHAIFGSDGVFWSRGVMNSGRAGVTPQVFGHTPHPRSPIQATSTASRINVDVGLFEGYGGGRGFLEITSEGTVLAHRKLNDDGWAVQQLNRQRPELGVPV